MIGQTISHYKILEKLGEGGMGVVYKAQDTKLDRFVALKFLPPHLAASEQDKARFIQEAKSASALNHPNVCTIHDIQDHEGQIFIVMEFVDGQTLQEKKSSLSLKQGIDYGIQIAEGLAAAHEKGFVHRDIKPENIMIRKDGIVQVMDFGLAKLAGSSRLTKMGSTVGTLGYMSPEQVQGKEADHRSDIFSLGVLLYEMIAGRSPFSGAHETAILYEIVNVDAPPMSSVKPELDPELDRIVLECLQKEPDERYNSVKDIAKDLKRFKRESSRSRMSRISQSTYVPVEGSQRERKQSTIFTKERIVWISLMLVTAALFISSVIIGSDTEKKSPLTVNFTIQPPEKAILYETTVSPNGKIVAFTATGEGVTLLWIRPLSSLSAQSLPGSENAQFPFWSTDSRYIGFFADGKLKKIDVTGGTPIVICDVLEGLGGAWNASGEILFSDQGGLFRVSSAGGLRKQVTFLDSVTKESSHCWPSFLPDGKRFLFLSLRVADMASTTYLSSIEDTARVQIIRADANAVFVAPSKVLYLNNRTLMSQEFDLDKNVLSGEPHPVATNVGKTSRLALGDFSYSSAGILTTGGGRSVNRQFVWFNRSGQQIGIACPAGNYFDIALSPSGKYAAVQRVDVQTNNSDIWIVDLSRSLLSRFTFNAAVEDDPVWSADGKYVYFSSAIDDQYNIHRKAANGIGSQEVVTPVGLSQRPMDISRDNKSLLYQVDNSKAGSDIWILDLDNTKKTRPYLASEFSDNYPHLSPDGKWLAYTTNESGKMEVYVQSFSATGGRWQVSVNGGSQPYWRQDSRELFYIAPDLKMMSVVINPGATFDFELAKPLFLTRVDSYDAPKRYVAAENGQKFLMNIPVGLEFANPISVTINPDL